MGDLSPHFSKHEIACRCGGCGFDDINPALLYVLEAVREHFGKPVTITSGCRCEHWNRLQKGSQYSQHLPRELPGTKRKVANAADIKVKDIIPGVVADYCEALVGDRGGVGRYGVWTHVDVRGEKARWRG